jgi:hypothetical protein
MLVRLQNSVCVSCGTVTDGDERGVGGVSRMGWGGQTGMRWIGWGEAW